MSWVRIDDNAMDHPKFLAITDGAWRLWCEGQTYCRKHLTDGIIHVSALKGFRYYSPSRLTNLLTEHVPGKGPCWHREADGSIRVHDYLDWNDSRAVVLGARDGAKERRRRYERRTSERVPNAVPLPSPNAVKDGYETENVPVGLGWVGEKAINPKPSSHARGTNPSDFTPAVLNRVGDFIERYKAAYQKHRNGAFYVGNPQKDFQEAGLLCDTWDDERLDKLAHVFLTTDHDFAQNSSRTLAQFRSLASWCDGKLREAGL